LIDGYQMKIGFEVFGTSQALSMLLLVRTREALYRTVPHQKIYLPKGRNAIERGEHKR
jgi:hypothetical protein